MNRCLGDFFAYCRGEPKAITVEKHYGTVNLRGRAEELTFYVPGCKNDVETCPLFLTATQSFGLSMARSNPQKERVTERKRGDKRR